MWLNAIKYNGFLILSKYFPSLNKFLYFSFNITERNTFNINKHLRLSYLPQLVIIYLKSELF